MMENNDLKTNFNSSINNVENISEKSESENEPVEKQKKCSIIKILAFSAIILVSFCIILAVIIIVFVRHESTRPFTPEEIIGEIKCIYYINKINIKTDILSDKYKNNSEIDIVIDDKRIEFNKKYLFKEEGFHNISFYINSNETMDYMFYNITSLVSVELYSRKNITVISMKGSFKDCYNLTKFKNDGFNTSKVEYMNDFFHNSNLKEFNLEYNLDTSNVINMSQMFKNCKMLQNLNISYFSTINVVDFSVFFIKF